MGGLASPRAAETVPAPTIPARDSEAALNALVELVGDDLQDCNRAIIARMDSPVALIPQREHPFLLHRPSSRSTFAADDAPVDAVEVHVADDDGAALAGFSL